MSHVTLPTAPQMLSLRTVLLADAASCIAMGLLMSGGGSALAVLTGLPERLLVGAGLLLLPVGVLMAVVGTRRPIPAAGVWLVILGNMGWIGGSLLLFASGFKLTALGIAFVLVQAATVALLTALEYSGLRAQAPNR